MSATVIDLTIEQGATFEYEWSVVDENDAVADLSGYTAKMQIRRSASDTTALLTLSTADDSLTIVTATGLVIAHLDDAATLALTWRNAIYDVLLTDGTDTWRIVEGAVTVTGNVTEL